MSNPTTARSEPAAAAAGGAPLVCDVLVVGGGVNGVGIARDLAGRGASVVLAERDDLAQHTSSASTKLIHGGLRYLENYEFAMVRKGLAEREGLLRGAPHIMRPLRIVLPHDPSMRPAWMLRLGLFLYDHLAPRELLPGSKAVDLRADPAGAPLDPRYTRGFAYSDGWVDDARLVVLCAIDAAERGATILPRCGVERAERAADGWVATLAGDGGDGVRRTVRARALVNAAGPWAERFLRGHTSAPERAKPLRLVRGSHIVVPKRFDHDSAYFFQNTDGRIIFVQPYERDFTLIGTTDVEHRGELGDVRITPDEVEYLCAQVSRYFARPVAPADVVWSFAGVRPLIDDASAEAAAVTRDYSIDLDDGGGATLLNVWGGKLTTFRVLGEEAADRLAAPLGLARGAWTRGAVLPGGDLGVGRAPGALARFVASAAKAHPELPQPLVERWARLYGSRMTTLLAEAGGAGRDVAPGLPEAELRYLVRHEWARRADDILWRRTKMGLHLDADGRARVAEWCEREVGAIVAAAAAPHGQAPAGASAPARATAGAPSR